MKYPVMREMIIQDFNFNFEVHIGNVTKYSFVFFKINYKVLELLD